MEKLKLALILVVFLYALYQLAMGAPLLFISTTILSVSLFLVLCCHVDIFDGRVSALSTIMMILTVIHVVSASGALDFQSTKKQYDLMVQSMEAGFCPEVKQPDERKRVAFEQLKNTLFMSCAMQHNRNIMTLTVDLSKAVHLDPVTGTLDSIYSDFIKEKDMKPTCIELAQEMDRLCPGLLDI